MKKDIQPKVNTNAVVTCACGNSFVTTSTQNTISVDICSACHPFFTGQQKFVDTEGRIDKFTRKAKLMEQKKEKVAKIQEARAAKSKKSENKGGPQSLKELFASTQK